MPMIPRSDTENPLSERNHSSSGLLSLMYRHGWLPVLLLCTTVFVGGCSLWRTRSLTQYHSFNYPAMEKKDGPHVPSTLMVYRFVMAPTEQLHSLVVTGSKESSESSGSHRWKSNPSDMITNLLLRDIEDARIFRRTVGQFSSARYRYALEGAIKELRGVVRDGKTLAVIDTHVTFIDFEAPHSHDNAIMKKRYHIEIPCDDSTYANVLRGLNEGVKELSERLLVDLRSALRETRTDLTKDKEQPQEDSQPADQEGTETKPQDKKSSSEHQAGICSNECV